MVVVTGAAGALGSAVVADLVARGAEVVAMDRDSSALDDLGNTTGVRTIGVNLADRTDVVRAWEEVDEVGIPTALIALAGGFTPGSLADLDESDFDMLWSGNVATVLWNAQQSARRMAAAGGGAIVTVGSKTAVTGSGPVAHASSKAAVVRVTELLAEELRPAGVRVNTVLPSVLDTPANRTWMSADLASRAVSTFAVAKVIAFLISPESEPISGARIPVYGRS
ncbi:SDR family NAD(P)-dependent oxidoreductase [Rhodococcus sp. IEGM 1366]|uniref:SDR family NAD(P)-dependent oxidoreductase n=1 Tax=Rhodococcus sp. IEGM 1366 TaxID=3082223 RepID=UPI0029541078|nr:SDR family NAD(P)-dependent oxidoreductase [Rhodococcus sp. IEGM 1366]MDV8071372.1 SDR family NAD(P)-dependent oxidoreductase [Rhodococcus sp. IEGM 1366]